MKDRFERTIEYLRLSVTDLCNYRCIYCMNEDGIQKKTHSDILSIEELTEIVRAAHSLKIKKVRLTGGEPLLRRGILTLCENIKAIDPAIELSLTTNGSLLYDMAKPLKEAGVDRINLSLDTLGPNKFRKITRTGEIFDVMNGLKAAQLAGFEQIKINVVLMGGVNTDEIKDFAELTRYNDYSVRFIELMPMNVCKGWDKSRFVSNELVLSTLKDLQKIGGDGVSRLYRMNGCKGTIGLISPISQLFCYQCNRIRITADGFLKPCLHSEEEFPLRGLTGDDLTQAIKNGILAKPLKHNLDCFSTQTPRDMNRIGG
ncbi:MAG: GTP 3',8-cyclase MoaA [Ruminococcus sp.]|nr:GTP 3',8-cyclase MoaA [Ruminococcus sp.]